MVQITLIITISACVISTLEMIGQVYVMELLYMNCWFWFSSRSWICWFIHCCYIFPCETHWLATVDVSWARTFLVIVLNTLHCIRGFIPWKKLRNYIIFVFLFLSMSIILNLGAMLFKYHFLYMNYVHCDKMMTSMPKLKPMEHQIHIFQFTFHSNFFLLIHSMYSWINLTCNTPAIVVVYLYPFNKQ